MIFNEFVKKYKGKGIDYDGAYGVQCFDLANQYCKDVLSVSGFVGLYAHMIYNNFSNQPNKSEFTRISNTPDFVPKKGDIVVWAASLNGAAGHVAIATGEGTTKYFYSWDQNWSDRNDPMTKIKHNYNHVLGVLRPKDQAKVLGQPKGCAIGSILFRGTHAYITVDGLRLRKSPSDKAKILGTLKKGDKILMHDFKFVGSQTWAKTTSSRWVCVNNNSFLYVRVRCKTKQMIPYYDSINGKVLGYFAKGRIIYNTDREAYGWGSSHIGKQRIWFNLAYCERA